MPSTFRRIALRRRGHRRSLPVTGHRERHPPPRGSPPSSSARVTVGGKDYIVRQITVQPGGSTGWHYHDGTLYAFVEAGTLTHTESDCATTDVYHKGRGVRGAERGGNVHIGRNLGSTPVVLDVLYVDPAGSPLSEDAPNPGCGFQ